MVVMPFNTLQPGIWQFVCSGGDEPDRAWHQILKLKVLPHVQSPPPPPPIFTTNTTALTEDITSPIALIPAENWSGELDRLLSQIVHEEQPIPLQQPVEQIPTRSLQIQPITTNPEQILAIEQTTFSLIPGDLLTIYGNANLRLFGEKLLRKVTIDKLLICLRHPETAEILVLIESPLPPAEPTFAFSCQLTLPPSLTIDRLVGEVSLYDRYNIQLAAICFRVEVKEASAHTPAGPWLDSLDLISDDSSITNQTPAEILDQLGRELGVTEAIKENSSPIELPDVFKEISLSPSPVSYPSRPSSDRQELRLDPTPRLHSPTARTSTKIADRSPQPKITTPPPEDSDILSGELLFDIDLSSPILDRPLSSYDTDTLEVVVED